MSTAPTPAAPAKVSWLKRLGQFFGKVLGVIATTAQPIEKMALPVAQALLPQFAPLISTADGIFSSIVREAVAAESALAAVGQATGTGPQKLAIVLQNIGPAVDNWVTSNFPGAKQISTAAKSGLVSAVVGILNEVEGTNATLAPTPGTSAAGNMGSAPAPAPNPGTGTISTTAVGS